MYKKIVISFWASTITPEDRSNSNYTDGIAFRDIASANQCVKHLRRIGCAVRSCEVHDCESPHGGDILESFEEYLALPTMTANQIREIRLRSRCRNCGELTANGCDC